MPVSPGGKQHLNVARNQINGQRPDAEVHFVVLCKYRCEKILLQVRLRASAHFSAASCVMPGTTLRAITYDCMARRKVCNDGQGERMRSRQQLRTKYDN